MEYIDILDKNGNSTGEVKERSDVHRSGDWHRSVVACILNSKGELLIQKRASSVEKYPNLWTLSFGGHMAAGDISAIAVIREASEELGVELQESDCEKLFSVPVHRVHDGGSYIDNVYHDTYLVRKDILLSSIQLQAEEVSAVRWVTLKEFEQKIHERDPDFVQYDELYEPFLEVMHKRFPEWYE